jgi:hypothetical protein
MTWIFFLAIAVIVAMFAWFTQIKPSGTRRIRGTHLMAVGRVFLGILIGVLVLLAARSAFAELSTFRAACSPQSVTRMLG